MFDHLYESSQWDKSNKWSNLGFGEEIGIIEIEMCILSGALKVFKNKKAYCAMVWIQPVADSETVVIFVSDFVYIQ